MVNFSKTYKTFIVSWSMSVAKKVAAAADDATRRCCRWHCMLGDQRAMIGQRIDGTNVPLAYSGLDTGTDVLLVRSLQSQEYWPQRLSQQLLQPKGSCRRRGRTSVQRRTHTHTHDFYFGCCWHLSNVATSNNELFRQHNLSMLVPWLNSRQLIVIT